MTVGLAVVSACATGQESRTLNRIRETGVVTIGYRVASRPFSYLDAKRRPIGYSIEICDRIVEVIRQRLMQPDLEIRRVPVMPATRLPMLANGTVDLECGVTTNTIERQKMAAFSVTIFVAESRLLSRASDNIRSLDDLAGRSVATTLSTTSMQFLVSANRSRRLNMRIHAGTDDTDAFQMVRSGSVVAFALDDALLHGMVAAAPDGDNYRISEEALTVEPYAIGMNRDDSMFKQLVDEVIISLYRQGSIDEIYKRWFESPIPGISAGLKMPMSEALRRVITRPTDSGDPAAYR